MSNAEIHIDPDRDLTQICLRGILAPEQFDAAMRDDRFGQTGLVLWDLRNASFSNMSRDRLQTIARKVKKLEARTNWTARGTAVVANRPEDLLMIQLYFEIARYVVKREIVGMGTTSIQEAEMWLESLPPRAVGANAGDAVLAYR